MLQAAEPQDVREEEEADQAAAPAVDKPQAKQGKKKKKGRKGKGAAEDAQPAAAQEDLDKILSELNIEQVLCSSPSPAQKPARARLSFAREICRAMRTWLLATALQQEGAGMMTRRCWQWTPGSCAQTRRCAACLAQDSCARRSGRMLLVSFPGLCPAIIEQCMPSISRKSAAAWRHA
jgi:ribosomal protein S25